MIRIPFSAYPAFVSLLACLAMLVSPEASDAQGPPTPSGGSGTPYEAIISVAIAEFELDHFPEALALFEQAHALLPNARTLRGIGMCAFEMRDYPQAWAALRGSLGHRSKPLTATLRARVSELLSRTETFLGRLQISGVPTEGTVTIDGRNPVTDGPATLLGPGPHVVRVEAHQMLPWETTVQVEPGRTMVVHAEMQRASARASDESAPSQAPTLSGVGSPEGVSQARSRGPWILGGAGAALFATGLVVGSVGLVRARDEAADASNARRLGYAADSMMAVGLGAAAGALMWGLLSRRSSDSNTGTHVVFAPTPYGFHLALSDSF